MLKDSFIQGEYILFSIIVFICLFSVLTAIIFYKGYKDMQYQQQISDMNFEMLKRQYEMIQKMYTEKKNACCMILFIRMC